RLENQALRAIYDGQKMFNLDGLIKVGIHQFYGIEINDFAVTVAKTALWIAESQMMHETEEIIEHDLDFLPLKSYANIVEGNSLRIDWSDVVPKEKLSYIMGNPPFVGYSLQSKEQKADILRIYVDEKGKPYKTAGKIDYVSGWYFKACELMRNTAIRTAFVSTNSITQGEQVSSVWKPLYERFGIHIDFAHRTFRWDSEANLKAHVHCVIVGFSIAENKSEKKLFDNGTEKIVKNINPYLVDFDIIFIEDRKKPLCKDVSIMNKGSQGTDDGAFYFSPEEYKELIAKYPNIKLIIREATNGQTFINNTKRYCLWCDEIAPAELKKYPEILERIQRVKNFRLASSKEATRKWADYPYLFTENRQPKNGNYLLLPLTSSEKRRYVPIGYLPFTVIANNSVQLIPNATLYDFGVLTSNVFMAWMRTVCGRLEMRYRITVTNVYNNFPWCTPNENQKKLIEKTAQEILNARQIYNKYSLADLYDELTMPPELRKAHQQNDFAVMSAYGFDKKITESECVAELMKMYQKLTK
ncbi:MAG: methylase, partial [Prevotella sp.]|nr:methylase [Prevotella sp.]